MSSELDRLRVELEVLDSIRHRCHEGHTIYGAYQNTKDAIAGLEAKQEKTDKARIAELEDQVRAEREMVRTHFAELQSAKAELAALKERPQEVPPLDKWRVLATAKKIMIDLANEKEDAECVMWLTASDSIAHPIAYTVGSPVPYDVK